MHSTSALASQDELGQLHDGNLSNYDTEAKPNQETVSIHGVPGIGVS